LTVPGNNNETVRSHFLNKESSVATLASRPAGTASPRIPAGVAPLRAGQGSSFLWRRLHSLSGIFPVGAFLVEHFVSNAFATNGPNAYAEEVKFLTGLPFLVWVEVLFIYIPILYHSLYGFWIWYRGESNIGSYTFIGNWGYSIQRWTGAIAFFYMLWHTLTMRWMGVHIVGGGFNNAFGKVQLEFQHPYAVAFYAIGILCASVHFSYGLWLFAAKWGITTGEKGRRNFGYACGAICALFLVLGYASMYAFLSHPQQPVAAPAAHVQQALVNQ
jgi:succinate dehydrogenase / fumarate reductase cytochrome b subunit